MSSQSAKIPSKVPGLLFVIACAVVYAGNRRYALAA
jgi:hypothetical protein